MAKTVTLYKVLVASPYDVKVERNAVLEVVHAWNAVNMDRYGAILHPVLWETHSAPEMGARPQEIINRNLVSDCDILVGAFWTRLGTSTGKAASGTVEEIEQFIESKKPVLLYFSSMPITPESVDLDQYKLLKEFKEQCYSRGLVASYEDVGQFRNLLRDHLTSHVNRMHEPPANEKNDDMEGKEEDGAKIFIEQFVGFVRRLEADWEGERDSDPMSTDDGKIIIKIAADRLSEFRSMIANDRTGELTSALSKLMIEAKKIQRHQTYIDGGVSFDAFWSSGDDFVKSVKNLAGDLSSLIGL
ncbi:hypothetical protein [Azospirillum palustre]